MYQDTNTKIFIKISLITCKLFHFLVNGFCLNKIVLFLVFLRAEILLFSFCSSGKRIYREFCSFSPSWIEGKCHETRSKFENTFCLCKRRKKWIFISAPWWKPRRTFGRNREQISENPRRISPAREFSQTLPIRIQRAALSVIYLAESVFVHWTRKWNFSASSSYADGKFFIFFPPTIYL